MYGIQTKRTGINVMSQFENDVNMYGIQIKNSNSTKVIRLRKM